MNKGANYLFNVKCKGCQEPYSQSQQPKILPCGHSRCSLCLFQDSQTNGYYYCPDCHYKFDPLDCSTPTNYLYFQIMQKAHDFLHKKQWQSSSTKQLENFGNQYHRELLKLEEQCLYTFCQRKKYQNGQFVQLFCSQECKQAQQELQAS